MVNWCNRCNGFGRIKDLDARRWQFWKFIKCPICGGDGYAKPPADVRTTVYPPKPPIRKFYCSLCQDELKLGKSGKKGHITGHCSNCGKWHILT